MKWAYDVVPSLIGDILRLASWPDQSCQAQRHHPEKSRKIVFDLKAPFMSYVGGGNSGHAEEINTSMPPRL
jgi:hypothetical protein